MASQFLGPRGGSMSPQQQRLVALIDMDCFYVQVEQRDNPSLKGKPCAVVQYKKWKGGGIIAVGYEARACGVTRQMRGDDARAKCPQIHLVRVPEVRGKADLNKYREAGAEVIEVLSRFSDCVERASIDEAYIDLTEEVDKKMVAMGTDEVDVGLLANSFVVAYHQEVTEDDSAKDKEDKRRDGVNAWLQSVKDNADTSIDDLRLAVAGVIVEEMRAAVYADTGFRCSAGVAHNKMLAKLTCGLHKPNRQTLLPHSSINHLFSTMPIKKVRGFGGKFGDQVVEQLRVHYMVDLQQFTETHLHQNFGKYGTWVYEVCRGIEKEPVSARQLPKSIGCGKNFPGKERLDTKEKVRKWLSSLCEEVSERLVKDKKNNHRVAKHLVVYCRQAAGENEYTSGSKSCPLVRYDADKITNDTYILLSKFDLSGSGQTFWHPPIHTLGVSASKFSDLGESTATSIKGFLTKRQTPSSTVTNQNLSTSLPSDVYKQIQSSQKVGSIMGFFSQMGKNSQSETKTNGFLSNFGTQPTQQSGDESEAKSESFVQLHGKSGKESDGDMDGGGEKKKMKGFFAKKKERFLFLKEDSNDSVTVISDIDEGKTESLSLQGESIVVPPRGSSGMFNAVKKSPGSDKNGQINELPYHVAAEETVGLSVPSGGTKDGHQSDDKFSASDYVQCEKCQQNILIWEMPEHSDFHFAMDLQKQNDHQETQARLNLTSQLKRKNVNTPTVKGRKKSKLTGVSGTPKLEHFFKK